MYEKNITGADFFVSEADLNDIDNQNGSGSVAYDTQIPQNKDGKYMTGALNPLKLPNKNYNNGKNNQVWNAGEYSSIVGLNSNRYFFIILQQLIQASIELLDYKNLPDDLDKYKIEYLLKNNGVCGIINIANRYYVVPVIYDNMYNNKDNFSKKDGENNISMFNMGYKPSTVKVMPGSTFSNLFKNKKFIVDEDIFLIRNNLYMTNTFINISRWIVDIENCWFHIEKNIKVSSPKAILFTGNNLDSDELAAWEQQANSDDTYFQMKLNEDYLEAILNRGIKTPFLPISFDDKTERLIENLKFMWEKIKETLGFDTMSLGGKKERVITGEMDASNSMASYNLQHIIELRNNDLKTLNKVFSLNIIVEKKEITTELDNVKDNQLGGENE